MLLCHLYISFDEWSVWILSHLKKIDFIIFLFHLKYSLYIWIQVLYQICELQIFSPSLGLVEGMWLLKFLWVILNLWVKAPDLIETGELEHLYLLLALSISYCSASLALDGLIYKWGILSYLPESRYLAIFSSMIPWPSDLWKPPGMLPIYR